MQRILCKYSSCELSLPPDMFSLLIDNTSWLFPAYLKGSRYLYNSYGNCILSIEFDHLAKTLEYDEEILYLPSLYKMFKNKCNIICCHGTSDNLINHMDKRELKKIISNFHYNEINDSKVDKVIFKSTRHGLDADFLELFDYTIKNMDFELKDNKSIQNENVYFETSKNRCLIDYSNTVPFLHLESK